MTVEEALRAATGDAGLTVAYWISEREIWANEDGSPRVPRSKVSPSSAGRRPSAS